jgi:hypothetical protein
MLWVKEHFPEIMEKTSTWLLIEVTSDDIIYAMSAADVLGNERKKV